MNYEWCCLASHWPSRPSLWAIALPKEFPRMISACAKAGRVGEARRWWQPRLLCRKELERKRFVLQLSLRLRGWVLTRQTYLRTLNPRLERLVRLLSPELVRTWGRDYSKFPASFQNVKLTEENAGVQPNVVSYTVAISAGEARCFRFAALLRFCNRFPFLARCSE